MLRLVVVCLLGLVVLVPAAYAQEPPRIRDGVSVAGVPVSGLTVDEAAAVVEQSFGDTLRSPVKVHVKSRRFKLRPDDIGLVFDALKTAQRAYDAGVETPPAGDSETELQVDVAPYVKIERGGVKDFVSKVRRKTVRRVRNARLRMTLKHMRMRAARAGRAIRTKQLRPRLRRVIHDPRLDRDFRITRAKVQPEVRRRDLKRRYPTVLTISKSGFRLRLFKRLRWRRTYGVAVGMPAYPTPSGRFSITSKAVNPAWSAPDQPWAGAYRNEVVPGGSAENPLKARWLGITGGVGIHGTGEPWTIGTRASHGCIRMTVPDVVALYPRVPVGTPVLIR